MSSQSYIIHEQSGTRILEVTSADVILSSPQDLLDILGDVWGQEAEALVLHEHNVSPSFFDLKTGLAGEILQKCSNYNLRFTVVGDFERYSSDSLQAFIRESNRGKRIDFAKSLEEALQALADGGTQRGAGFADRDVEGLAVRAGELIRPNSVRDSDSVTW